MAPQLGQERPNIWALTGEYKIQTHLKDEILLILIPTSLSTTYSVFYISLTVGFVSL